MDAGEKRADCGENPAHREMFASRVLDAPRGLVWKLWTEPQHIAKWWGPKGFTITTSEMNLTPGGLWQHVMHGPDGKNDPNKIVFVEVVKPERIVYDHESHPRFRVTVSFEEEKGKTRVTMRMVFEPAELPEKTDKQLAALEGQRQTLGRLEELVLKMPVVVERLFDAPAEMVWKAITEIDRMKNWFLGELQSFKAEVGFETEFDVQHQGKVYPHLWKVLEVVPGKKIAVEWKFGGMSGSSVATMELFPEGARTRFRLTHEGLQTFPQDNPDFSRGSFEGGWNALIGEGLRSYLAKE